MTHLRLYIGLCWLFQDQKHDDFIKQVEQLSFSNAPEHIDNQSNFAETCLEWWLPITVIRFVEIVVVLAVVFEIGEKSGKKSRTNLITIK